MASTTPAKHPVKQSVDTETGRWEVIPGLKFNDMAAIAIATLNITTRESTNEIRVIGLLMCLFSPFTDNFTDFLCRALVPPSASENQGIDMQMTFLLDQVEQVGTFQATVAKLAAQQEAYRDAAETEAVDAKAIDIKEGEVVNVLVSHFGQGALAALSATFMPEREGEGYDRTIDPRLELGVNAEMLKEVLTKLSVKTGFSSKFERFEKGVEAALRLHQRVKST